MTPEERLAELTALGLPEELARLQVQVEFGGLPSPKASTPVEPVPSTPPAATPASRGMGQGAAIAATMQAQAASPMSPDSAMEPAPMAADPSTAPVSPELQALLDVVGQADTQMPLDTPPGQDPYTGAVQDPLGLLNFLSQDSQGREELFDESLYTSPSYGSAPSSVRSFLSSRFDPLESQYLAQGIADPSGGDDFRSYLMENPQVAGADEWRNMFESINTLASGVQSEEDVMQLGQTQGGPSAAAYELLRNQGADILGSTVGQTIHPALANAARRILSRDLMSYQSAAAGAPSNEAEFVRQQAPLWEQILANR